MQKKKMHFLAIQIKSYQISKQPEKIISDFPAKQPPTLERLLSSISDISRSSLKMPQWLYCTSPCRLSHGSRLRRDGLRRRLSSADSRTSTKAPICLISGQTQAAASSLLRAINCCFMPELFRGHALGLC